MKKKYSASSKDKNDWITFTKQMGKILPKEEDILDKNFIDKNDKKLDLHGFSLEKANEKVKKFIIESYDAGFKKILIVTGKGSRSKSYENPYQSKKLSVLKYSIPEFIKNNENLSSKVSSISKAELKDGGEGAIYVFLKNNKDLEDKL